MDILEIQKSLYNKDIDTVSINPEIIVNDKNKEIKNTILKHLNSNQTSHFDIAVSYVVWSGLSLLYPSMIKYDERSRMIVTTEGFVTSPMALRKLLSLNFKTKVYMDSSKGFHMKSYTFYSRESSTIIIGSANISSRAYGEVHEMIIRTDSLKGGKLLEQYKKTFKELWESEFSYDLTEELIDNYELEYKKVKAFERLKHFEYLNETLIKPNYMQRKALEQLISYRKVFDKGLVIAATGTGKTYLSAFDAKQFEAKKLLFLVHNRTILRSAIQTYRNIFKDKKIIELKSNNLDALDENHFVFTTNRTAYKYLINNLCDEYFDYIVYDEAHKIGFDTQYDAIMKYFTPKFSLGMTATPERTDNPEFLFNQFDFSIPYEIRLIDSLNHGLICPFTYYGLDADIEEFKKGKLVDYSSLAKFIGAQILKLGHSGTKLKGLIFCSNRKEALALSEQLSIEGLPSKAVVSGKFGIDEDEIISLIDNLQNDEEKNVNLLCVVDKFNEGVDIPEINTIIMLRNTKSSIIFLQQLGRGLRLTSDKNKFVTVIDLIGNSKKNYTIAEALTGRTTVDQEKLIKHTLDSFETISPYINVNIEEVALNKILRSISNSFKAITSIKNKFREELTRYEEIPTLKDLYMNPRFNELELLQLLGKEFFTPFANYYKYKYSVNIHSSFLPRFFALLSQFVFRSFDRSLIKEYVKVLKGFKVENDELARIIAPYTHPKPLYSPIMTNYHTHYPDKMPFIYKDKYITLNPKVINILEKEKSTGIFAEHIELFEYISTVEQRKIVPFTLLTKVEFLYNRGHKNLSMMTGQEDYNGKVYCPIVIKKDVHKYENKLLDEETLIYQTQGLETLDAANRKINKIKEYVFEIAIQFPHLKYERTSYFYVGEVSILSISPTKKYTNKDGKIRYNQEICFKLKNKVPKHLLLYKETNYEKST